MVPSMMRIEMIWLALKNTGRRKSDGGDGGCDHDHDDADDDDEDNWVENGSRPMISSPN